MQERIKERAEEAEGARERGNKEERRINERTGERIDEQLKRTKNQCQKGKKTRLQINREIASFSCKRKCVESEIEVHTPRETNTHKMCLFFFSRWQGNRMEERTEEKTQLYYQLAF